VPTDDPDERARERVGATLNDKWTLERLIGIGGMAAVYAGLHRNGARAAVKVLHPVYARRKEVRERFLREGYAANRVGHSGVVKVLDDDIIDAGPDQGGAFLVMELLEGESLEDRLERGRPVTEAELLAIVRAVLDVLEVAHAAGVVHRDLKPENLFLARDPEHPSTPPKIKILDFGLARVAEAKGKTMAGVAIGTPSYMPPEQAAGRVQEIDARSDLFALGATCFRVLAGRTVHPAEGAMAICALMAREPAPPLRSVAPNVSEKTAAVIDRALAFRREDRFQTAAEMRAAVDEAIAALGGELMAIDSGIREAPTEPPERPPRKLPPVPRAKRSPSVFGWLLAALALGIAAKLGYDRLAPRAAASPDGEAPAVSDSASTAAVEEPEDAALDGAELDAPIDDALSDAEWDDAGDAEAPDGEAEDAAVEAEDATVEAEEADAEAAAAFDAGLTRIARRDAGAPVKHHRDSGTHHRRHHTKHPHVHRR
jgi:serine/threonine protein kinase